MKIGDTRRRPCYLGVATEELVLGEDGVTVLNSQDHWGYLVSVEKIIKGEEAYVQLDWKHLYWDAPTEAELLSNLGWWERRQYRRQKRQRLPKARVSGSRSSSKA